MSSLNEIYAAQTYEAVTPHATTNFPGGIARSLYVGTEGHVVAVGLDGVAVTFKNVPNGSVLPTVAMRVNAIGTTATDIVALF